MGEKDYLYKNSLWQESTRVPLIIKAPGVSQIGQECRDPVSLIDVYPTLLDLCQLPTNTRKNGKGHDLDGHSLKPLLKNPANGQWRGPSSVLTALYKWRTKHSHEGKLPLRARFYTSLREWQGEIVIRALILSNGITLQQATNIPIPYGASAAFVVSPVQKTWSSQPVPAQQTQKLESRKIETAEGRFVWRTSCERLASSIFTNIQTPIPTAMAN